MEEGESIYNGKLLPKTQIMKLGDDFVSEMGYESEHLVSIKIHLLATLPIINFAYR